MSCAWHGPIDGFAYARDYPPRVTLYLVLLWPHLSRQVISSGHLVRKGLSNYVVVSSKVAKTTTREHSIDISH